ncbi:MAG: Gfo/Idh/MocA family oxidoreductase [Thermoproteota archaeon]
MRTFGVGVLGLHEGRTMLGALTRTTNARAVAACDINPAKIAEASARYPDIFCTISYDELLQHPVVDIVAIFTPDPLHGQHIVRAFAAGKYVICTKPVVNTVANARRILEASRKSTSKLLVGQSTRFFEPFLRQ